MAMEVWSVVIYSSLIFLTVVMQASYAAITAGLSYGFSNREQPQPNKTPFGDRIDRTLGNLKEGGIIYLPLALLAISIDVSNSWTYYAALLTIVSRALYVPVFLSGVKVVRTLIWLPSLIAIPLVMFGIATDMASKLV